MHFTRLSLPDVLRGGTKKRKELDSDPSASSSNDYLIQMKAWQDDRFKKYKNGWRLGPFSDPEPDDPTAHKQWLFYKKIHEERHLSKDEFDWIADNLHRHGLDVVIHVDPLPDKLELFDKYDTHYDDEGIEKKKPLLQIRLTPGPLFIEIVGRLWTDEEKKEQVDYHLSLCFTSDLHRFNLLDSEDGVRKGKAAYEDLRKYDGKAARLAGWVHNTNFDILKGMRVEGDLPDMLESAPFIMLHNAGIYAQRDHHISM
jgi:hypothetical protein